MGGVATIAPFLDGVTSLAKGGADLLRNAEVFALNPHSVKSNGVTAHLKLLQLLGVALPAFVGKNHGLLVGGCLMIGVTGDAIDPVLCVLRFYPRLKKSRRPLLMARDTETYVDSLSRFLRRACAHREGQAENAEK